MFDVQSLHPDNVQKRIKAICEKLDKLEASPEDGAWPSAEQWLKSREMEDYFVYYHINKKLSQLLTEYAAHVKKK
jgi:hypothetical protein